MKSFKLSAFILCLIISFIAIIGTDKIALFFQNTFNITDQIYLGNAKIEKSDEWMLSYMEEKFSNESYMYGIIPVFKKKDSIISDMYIYTKLKEPKKTVVFSYLDFTMSEKAKKIITKINNNSTNDYYEYICTLGFPSIFTKKRVNSIKQFTIIIPELLLFINTDSVDSLNEFKIKKIGNKNSMNGCIS